MKRSEIVKEFRRAEDYWMDKADDARKRNKPLKEAYYNDRASDFRLFLVCLFEMKELD